MATVGTVIGGRFRVDHVLGAGGMGVVVAATHLELGHRVAIKLLRDEISSVPTAVERFLREARSVVHLRTEHVCRVIDVGRLDTGAPFMVMEMLEGSDLGRIIAKHPLAMTIAVEYVMQACVALAEAHAAGIVHRDLKPANLFVTRRPGGGPLIKVLDFGIAKAMTEAGAQLTHSHSMLGSPGYISPEQLQSARDVDVRTDIWALGATLYQLLSARLPFYRPNATEMAVRIVMEPPDPLDVDPALRAVVFRCLEKSPALRYSDVTALAADLAPFGGPSGRAIAAVVGQQSRPAPPLPPAPTPVVSPFAMTAASVASSAPPSRPPPVPPTVVAASLPRASTPAGTSARRKWWIAAPLIVLASAAAAAIYARREPLAPAAPAQGSAAAITVSAPAVDAAVAAPSPSPGPATLDAGAPDPRPPGPRSKDPRTKDARAKAVQPPAPRPRTAAPASTASGRDPDKPAVAGISDTAREAKTTCFESAADTPWSTAMCWCTKKDQVRAQAAFAKLTGFRRRTVREYCSIRGIKL